MYKMLIADDEVLIRESLAACIDWTAHDIRVIGCCRNGIEALDAIIDKYPDILLTDIKMPGLSGLELIEKIHEQDCDMEIIIISGYREFEYAKQAIRFGVVDYLLKPLNEVQLLKAIEGAKKRRHQKIRVKSILGNQSEGEQMGSGVVFDIQKYVVEHLSEPGLTLKWIAENVLFMNVDYVSRKFLSETNEKFSAFLTRTRMETAKTLLLQVGKDGVSEVAARVGCGNSQRYFGQMFKKYTGLTPVQYLHEQSAQ